jgi:membrane fusion protein (multidrug efflux system)
MSTTTTSGLSGRGETTTAARPRRSVGQRLRLPLMILAPVIVIVGSVYFYAIGGRYVSSDDSYVDAARTSVSTDISARVVSIAVHDNQLVKTGDELFKLDPKSFEIAVQDARANLASAKLQVTALKASYGQKQADLKAAQDTLAYQTTELTRQKKLATSGISSQAQIDQANHAVDAANQAVAGAQQQIAQVLASLGGDPNIDPVQHPMVQQAQARLDQALLDLSYTVIRAPEDGIVTKVEQLQVGDFVNKAMPVFSLMSNTRVWIEGNFKETDLTHMRVGQTATVDVDTYPDVTFQARVESLSPGTGSSFSLLPPENATGNWVKVVQRLPVRFELINPNPEYPLHTGLSATVEVDTGFKRKLLSMFSSDESQSSAPQPVGLSSDGTRK